MLTIPKSHMRTGGFCKSLMVIMPPTAPKTRTKSLGESANPRTTSASEAVSDPVQQSGAGASASIVRMDGQPLDMARCSVLIGPHGTDNLAAFHGLQKPSVMESEFHAFQCLGQRRDREVVVDGRLALVGKALQGQDVFGILDGGGFDLHARLSVIQPTTTVGILAFRSGEMEREIIAL